MYAPRNIRSGGIRKSWRIPARSDGSVCLAWYYFLQRVKVLNELALVNSNAVSNAIFLDVELVRYVLRPSLQY